MRTAKIADLKNHLSRYLAIVRQGETVRVLDRNTPVAHIVPIRPSGSDKAMDDAGLAELERKGLVRRANSRLESSFFRTTPKGPSASVLSALLEEREGR